MKKIARIKLSFFKTFNIFKKEISRMKQITLMEAYLIEILRSNDVSKNDILQAVENKKVTKFQTYHKDFDFTLLYELQKNLKDILIKGYQVKFLTLSGLKNLLRMKYDIEEGNDYDTKVTRIEKHILTKKEYKDIKKRISTKLIIIYT